MLIIKRGVGNIGSTEEFERSRVKHLRYAPKIPHTLDGRGPRLWAGPVAFDYGSSIVRFAKGLSQGAAREIIQELDGRLQ